MLRSVIRPILYYDKRSPPVRSCLLLIKSLNIDVDLKFVDLFKQENLTEEYRKLNPMHTVPVLKDQNLILTDSHAILIYLCEKYDLENNYYPKDQLKRIQIINKLFFESSILFARDSAMMMEIFSGQIKDASLHKEGIHEAYDFLEIFLGTNKYMACNQLTIADMSIVTTLSVVDIVFPLNSNKWPRLTEWFNKMKTIPHYEEANEVGLNKLKDALINFAQFEIPPRTNE